MWQIYDTASSLDRSDLVALMWLEEACAIRYAYTAIHYSHDLSHGLVARSIPTPPRVFRLANRKQGLSTTCISTQNWTVCIGQWSRPQSQMHRQAQRTECANSHVIEDPTRGPGGLTNTRLVESQERVSLELIGNSRRHCQNRATILVKEAQKHPFNSLLKR